MTKDKDFSLWTEQEKNYVLRKRGIYYSEVEIYAY